jgi:hypothetical protein
MLSDQPLEPYETLLTNEGTAQDLHKLCHAHAETRGAFGIRQYEENQALSIWNVAIAAVLF